MADIWAEISLLLMPPLDGSYVPSRIVIMIQYYQLYHFLTLVTATLLSQVYKSMDTQL